MSAAADLVPLANRTIDRRQIDAWVDQFHRDGYLFLRNVLSPEHVAELRSDLDRVLEDQPANPRARIHLHHRMFETSRANLRLFDLEPVVTFAEALIAEVCHVIHNNSFRSPVGGGISTWHQDDASHYLVTEGEPPTNIRLPVLIFTCNYYLTDVDTVEHGPTQVIPGSHLFGGAPPTPIEGTAHED